VLSVGAQISVADNGILLTPYDGGSATRLGTTDARIGRRWVFDKSRRVLWVGIGSGGPFRIALVE
jgi:hypothetical protein